MADQNSTRQGFRPIPGYEGRYEISQSGTVKRVSYVDPRGHFRRSKVVSPSFPAVGGSKVTLFDDDGGRRSILVRNLVVAAFGISDDDLLRELIVSRSEPIPESGCWLWMGTLNDSGYAILNRKRVHRLSYEVFVGEIPKGMLVRHKCDVPCCVNPDHLIPGTPAQNIADMRSRGRNAVGEQLPHSVLTEQDVRQLRLDREEGVPASKLAVKFGIPVGHVYNVAVGKTWKHVC